MNPEIIPNDFAKKYPHIADWVADGTIEIGRQERGIEAWLKENT